MEKIRVLIADDHAIVRAGIKMLINSQSDMEVVGEAKDGNEAICQSEQINPDVVLMDLSMPPGKDGISATTELKKMMPGVSVLILTMHEDEEYLLRVLQAGASGYIIKNAMDSDLLSAIRAVHNGAAYLYPSASKNLVESLLKRTKHDEGDSHPSVLTEREKEILILIAKGYANKEIAEQLFISVKTVETHKSKVMEKLGVTTRPELVEYAWRKGMLDLDRPL
jgi:two-component system response regulator NreC